MRDKASKRRAAQPVPSLGRSGRRRVKVAARRRDTLEVVPKIEDTGIYPAYGMAEPRPAAIGPLDAEDEAFMASEAARLLARCPSYAAANEKLRLEEEPRFVKRKRSGPKSKTSPFLGVTRYKRTGRWEAHIWDASDPSAKRGRQLHLGSFPSADPAAMAYDMAALKIRGSKALLNYPDNDYQSDPFMVKYGHLDKWQFIKRLRSWAQGLEDTWLEEELLRQGHIPQPTWQPYNQYHLPFQAVPHVLQQEYAPEPAQQEECSAHANSSNPGEELNARRSSRLAAKQHDRKKITDGDSGDEDEDDEDDEADREDEEAASRQRGKSPAYKRGRRDSDGKGREVMERTGASLTVRDYYNSMDQRGSSRIPHLNPSALAMHGQQLLDDLTMASMYDGRGSAQAQHEGRTARLEDNFSTNSVMGRMPPRPYKQQDMQPRGDFSGHIYPKGPQHVITRQETRPPGNHPVVRVVTGGRHFNGVPRYADTQQQSPRVPGRAAPRRQGHAPGTGHSERGLGFTPYGWQTDSLSDLSGSGGGANSGRFPLTDEHIVNQVLARRFKVSTPPPMLPGSFDPAFNLEQSNNNFYGREGRERSSRERMAAALLEGLHARQGANGDIFPDDKQFSANAHVGLGGLSAYGQTPLMADISPRQSQGPQGLLTGASSRIGSAARPTSAGFVDHRGQLPGSSTFLPSSGMGARYYNPVDAGSSFQPTTELGAAPSLQSHAQLSGMPLRRLASEPVHFASDAQPMSHGFTPSPHITEASPEHGSTPGDALPTLRSSSDPLKLKPSGAADMYVEGMTRAHTIATELPHSHHAEVEQLWQRDGPGPFGSLDPNDDADPPATSVEALTEPLLLDDGGNGVGSWASASCSADMRKMTDDGDMMNVAS